MAKKELRKYAKPFGKKEKVLNYASNTYQLTRPNKVDAVMALIRECQPKALEEWEKFYFKPGNLGFPVFQTAYAKIGIFICYDRHFPESARVLALKGAEILFNPSATTAGKSQYLWELEQPASAVANGVFIGANNRVGLEKPWEFGRFYGSSYFVDPRGKIMVKGSDDQDELVIADLDLEVIREVRDGWQFFRDRRPEMYSEICEQLP